MLSAVNVSIESLNLMTLVPMLIPIVGALLIIVIELIKSSQDKSLYVMLSLLILGIDFAFLLESAGIFEKNGTVMGVFDVMLIDGLAILSQFIIVGASMLFIPLALTHKRFHEFSYPEFFALFLFMISGFQFMVATDNLILVFVGLETASLALYTLIAMHNRDKSFEAAVKYFTMGALAAGFFSFGSMIFYALTGSVEINQIAEVLSANGYADIGFVLIGVTFLLASFGFKLSMVPFHTWTPDVYEGSSAALAGYMSIVPKIAAFIVAMRFFEFLIHSGVVWLEVILYIGVVVTMTMANVWALVQTDVKRMLAYSSISHAGFVMAAILIGTTQSNSALFLYWILFSFTNLGSFSMLWISRQKNLPAHQQSDHSYDKFAGMVKTSPVAASIMALFMLSLAGLPPFALFWGKMYMISSAITGGYTVLALIMALNSAIAGYYYLKLIVYMFMKEPVVENNGHVYVANATLPLKTIIGIAAIGTIFAFVAVNGLLELITAFVYNSGY
ncbi:MAG: NADH-quinone oxidoreductase subunit N [Sulfurimonas sp. RIFOXYD12_FULL_33_39]|uniref:NADH-quinone oxidoreductase subunit NuoN n=1 Tax=unclassified Sulfurimonas TaxID=2623549 RepID=UPI0008B3067A|nr:MULTISPECIES: NADH-quinone oxidoreductase subunit NuoN [unclassified Sulfurimonas]OHE03094.1 MAG: NADH-quinone oxidoreductase subunit N [Sulfurimonas sp. RIFCSPLOWO2_12_FULL_34_6]OHE09706.1 MAG: NADH-quinone oxidoreductase subunit N [Sulfurimonas sp. RIFOXYD12_FULL_33_39]OHE13786.1 MAG: NADH-quinone oxidoreductase subunit N [Sulfurimonas sp. RIFOXYD2_FULL_34_21]DAB28710.1 MAG TPA: NADH-quinone oxidoreductase subunit NuoN [Sulfurimonas sp. UBA10385]